MGKRSKSVLRKKPAAHPYDGTENCVSRKLCVSVRKRFLRPVPDADPSWGPDFEKITGKRSTSWRGKPPPVNEAAIRAIYRVNKKLLDDLGVGVTVRAPRVARPSPSLEFVVGLDRKRR